LLEAKRCAREQAALSPAEGLAAFFKANGVPGFYAERLEKRGLPMDPGELAGLSPFQLDMTLAKIGCDPADELAIRGALAELK